MPYIRGFLYYFISYFTVIFHGIYGPTLGRFVPYKLHFKIMSSWNHFSLLLLRLTCGITVKELGKENIPAQGPVVILSNHESTWETVYFQTVFKPLSTVLKKELLRIPFFGWGLSSIKPIAIDRDNPRDAMRAVLKQGIARIKDGNYVLVFPEGTRNPSKKTGKYARSGAHIAVDAGVPVLPVAHNGSKCWPNGKISKYPGTVTVSYGPLIETAGKTSKEVTEEVQAWIEQERKKLD